MPNRREFCHALTLLSIAGLADACGGSPTGADGSNAPQLTSMSGVAAGNVVTVSVDAASPLATVGNAALVQSSLGSVLVARTAQSAFSALTAICTHQGCTVSGFQSGTYVCPCHGSEYSTSGAVVQGPATAPLHAYTTSFVSPTLTITIA